MRYLSVCSGIEAATMAWHPLGWQPAAFSEIEKFPRAVLAHHYPDVPCHGDFTTIRGDEYGPIDLLVGGTPCQSFSVAGLRGGLDDPRGNLALAFLQLARRTRARWVVWENVPGALSSSGGRDFGSILGGLAELGYGWAYRILDAQYLGVAQRRRRVFVVGHAGDWRRAAAVLFERHSLQGHSSPRREAGQSPAGTIGASVGDCSRDNIGESIVASSGRVAATLGAKKSGGWRGDLDNETYVAAIQERAVCENPDAGPDGAGFRDDGAAYTIEARTVPQAVAFALRGREGGAMPELGGDQIGALRSASGGSSRDYVAFDTTQVTSAANYSNPQPGDPCHPLASRAHPPAIAGSAVRRLTPRECERLQGFPDDYTLIPWRNGMAPDGPRYKALGNSMAVPVMAWIGRRIEAVEQMVSQEAAA